MNFINRKPGKLPHFDFFLIFSVSCFLLSFSRAHAVGTSAGAILLKSPDAKAIALGEAAVSHGADVSGITSIHYNPASSAFLEGTQVSFMGQQGIAEDNFGALSFGLPTVIGSFGGNIFYNTLGDVELINTQGISRTVQAQTDLGIVFNYSEELFRSFGTGINLKLLNSKIVDSFTSNAVAFDIGAQLRIKKRNLSFGIAILNIGSDVTFIETSDPLPLTTRIGGSYQHHFEDVGSLMLSIDAVKEREVDLKNFIGLEFFWRNLIALRTGYKTGQEIGKLGAGIGFLIGRWNIDYALTDNSSLGQSHNVSIRFSFGGDKYFSEW